MAKSELCAGVREMEHTADVGIEVEAGSLPELFHRAAAGMMALLRGEDGGWEASAPTSGRQGRDVSGGEAREPGDRLVELEGEDVGTLLVRWLRELLFLQELQGFAYREAAFEELGERRLRARTKGELHASPPVRELKGVTYHGLEVRREDGTWQARIIFDI